MRKKTFAILAGAFFLLGAGANLSQQPWQHMQNLTAAEIAAQWKCPQPEYGPEPYFGLSGPVSIAEVDRDLDTLHGLGFQAVTVQAGFGTPFVYLSPQYFDFFRQFVQETKKRDMRMWIVDDAGYPSGFAGGKFSTEKPNLRMQALEVAQKLSVAGGETLHRDLSPDTVSAAAINQDGAALPITLHGNTLDWVAPKTPKETWTVLVVDHEFRTSPTRSDTNPHRVKDTEQSLEDYMDPAATQQFLAFTHEQYKQSVGDEFGKTIMGFRGDEPDYSISGLPWTPEFFARFRELKGYDVQPYAALFAQTPSRNNPGVTIHLTPEQLRIKGDYYDVFSKLIAAGFFDPQGKWAASNQLEYQVHLNHEEMEMELTHSEGSFFRDMRQVEVPGIDAIWHQIWTDTVSDFPRLASSVSHIYGKPRAFTESFAAYTPQPDARMARYILNEQFVRGVNLIEMMFFPSTSAGPRPLSGYMGDPGFPDLVTYVRRMSYLMAMGRPDAAVALYLPSSSMWLGDRDSDTQFVSTERLLSEHQIDFDILSDDALARDLKAGKGTFETLSGNRYRTVILPDPLVISSQAFARLKSFAHGGGKVLFIGGTPKWIATRTIRNAKAATPADFARAKIVNAQLPPTPTPPQFPPTAPLQPQNVPDAILAALRSAVPEATVRLDSADPALKVMKRRWADADVYLLFNEGPQPSEHTVTLASKGSTVQSWNAQTAAIEPINPTRQAGSLSVRLKLDPYATSVLVVH
ncbi:MAG TPA: glycosyl hydrolase [Candidatus Acidoferrales bacterium]|nr:glycosyl hydrolase [Candidatus Acidoferrales bacterium]